MGCKDLSTTDKIKWIVNIVIPVVILLIPTNEVFTLQMKLFFASTVFAIISFAVETMNMLVVSIILPLFWVFFGVADATIVFQPWTQYIPWMMLSGFIMANVLESTGLLARVSYWCILKTGASYKGIVFGVAISGFLITMFVGNIIVPMAALTYGICTALNTGKSKASAGIMLTGAVSCLIPLMIKFTGPILMVGIGQSVTGPQELLGFFEAWYVNLPTILFYIILVFIAAFLFKPSTPVAGKDFFKEQLANLGKIKKSEVKCLIVIVIYFLFIITQKYHGLSLEWGLALVPMLMCVPVIGAATPKDIKNINYPFIFFISACMGIGSVATALGIGNLLITYGGAVLKGQNYFVFLVIAWVILVALNFVMTPLAMEAAFTVPLVTLGMAIGLNPMAIYYFILNAVDQVIFPYEYALYMIFFAFGLIHMKDFMKYMGIKMVLNFVIIFVVTLPWWKFIGFLFT